MVLTIATGVVLSIAQACSGESHPTATNNAGFAPGSGVGGGGGAGPSPLPVGLDEPPEGGGSGATDGGVGATEGGTSEGGTAPSEPSIPSDDGGTILLPFR